jgi:hypothetical protein
MFRWKAQLTNDGIFQVLTEQPCEATILQTNLELQKCDDPIPDVEGLGRWALSIPLLKWVELRRKYPALACKDVQIRSRAYMQFMNSDESIPYRVRNRI